MANGKFPIKELIRWIIDTYDLPPSLKQRISLIAERRIEELSLVSFDKQCRYISGLIDKFTGAYSERFFLSLDAPVKDDFRTTFHEIIEFQPQRVEGTSKISFYECLNRLEGKLEEHHLNAIAQLTEKCRENALEDVVFQEDALANPDEIKKRLELIHKYERKGRIVLPPRPIFHIIFNPLSKRFGRRRYNGNPLLFFRTHREYSNLTREQLRKFDRGLYESLRRSKQIDQIPRGKSYHDFPTPIDFFKSIPEYSDLTRGQLRKEDRALYVALFRAGQLHFLPKTIRSKIYQKKEYRGFPNPLEYFKAHPELHNLTRSQLAGTDESLYNALKKRNQLQEAIPKDYRFCINSH